MADISVSAEQNIDLSVKINADTKLQQELEETRARAEQLDFELRNATNTVKRLSEELNHLKTDRGILELEEHLDRFSETARRSLDEFNAFIKSVQLQDYADYGDGWNQFQDWIHDISTGAKTASEAIAEVKSEYSNLIIAGSGNSSGTIDSQMLRTFTSTLKSISNSIDEVREKLSEFQENGIRAIANEQGSDNTVSALEQVKNTIKEMADDANEAYEPLTRLINVMSDYANIDNTRLFTVSQAIAGLGEIGKGSYSVKSVENTINLLTRLQTLTKGGSINFNVSGLEAFSNLSIRKASLNNLATFLPTIASVDVGNLERLSHVDLSNFNNLDIKKTSMNNLVQMIEALNNTHMDTSWSSNLVQSANKLSGAVDNLISAMDGVVNRNTSISKGITSVARATQSASGLLGKYTVSLNEDNRSVLSSRLTGLDPKKIDEFVNRLGELSISAKSVKAQWEDSAAAGQKLAKVIIDGSNAEGDLVRHATEFNKKTGDISREVTEVTHKAKVGLEAVDKEVSAIKSKLNHGDIEASIEKAVSRFEKLGNSGASNLQQIKDQTIELRELLLELKSPNVLSDDKKLISVYQQLDDLLQKTINQISIIESKTNTTKKIDFGIETKKFQSDLDAVYQSYNKLNNATDTIRANLFRVEEAFNTLNNYSSTQDQKIAAYERLKELIPIVTKQIRIQAEEESKAIKIVATNSKIDFGIDTEKFKTDIELLTQLLTHRHHETKELRLFRN